MSVVFPVPASPISSVSDFAENNPYCRVLSASRCLRGQEQVLGIGRELERELGEAVETLVHERGRLRLKTPDHDHGHSRNKDRAAGDIHRPTPAPGSPPLACRNS